jgi:hypothetical protein
MSAARYKRALRILEQWPNDPSKGDRRDIGLLLRKRIGDNFKKADQSEISNPEKCDEMLTSLENLCSNKYSQKYPVYPELTVGSLILNSEECKMFVSEACQKEMLKQNTFFERKYVRFFGINKPAENIVDKKMTTESAGEKK